MKKILSFILINVLIACFLPVSAFADNSGVQVSGSAKISVVPDVARFSFAVNDRGKSLPELKLVIDRKSAAIISLCRNLGVDKQHITSAEISIHPSYNHQTQELTGYNVARTITVDLYHLDRYTDLVNGAIDSGITTINNIHLDIKDRDIIEAQALASAVKAAHQKAKIIAENAGIKLGAIKSVQETGGSFDNRRYAVKPMEMSDSAVSQAFEPGEISVMATVSVVYAIE